MKIIEYEIAGDTTIDGLVKNVNKHIEDGWEPIGGIGTSESGYYFQALIKYEPPVKTPICSEDGYGGGGIY